MQCVKLRNKMLITKNICLEYSCPQVEDRNCYPHWELAWNATLLMSFLFLSRMPFVNDRCISGIFEVYRVIIAFGPDVISDSWTFCRGFNISQVLFCSWCWRLCPSHQCNTMNTQHKDFNRQRLFAIPKKVESLGPRTVVGHGSEVLLRL